MKNKSLLIISLFLVLALIAFAETTYRVSGKITDEKGKGLPGANIVVVGTGKGASTNLSGEFTISDLPSGTYQFTVSMIGYETTSQDVTLVADQAITFSLLPKAYQSQPVVVTASRTRQRLQDSSVSTSVVEAEQIAERNFLSADEAMRFVGGVSMNDSQISIRNSTGFAYGTGSRVLVMVDGVPISSGDTGEIKWDALPIGQIEQLEVVKSAGSALYGSEAMGGVVNIITRKPDEGATYKISSEFGVWDKPAYEQWEWSDKTRTFHRVGIEHTRHIKDWGLLLSLEQKRDDSYVQASNFSRGQVFGKATRKVGESGTLSLMANVAYEDRGTGVEWESQRKALSVDPNKTDDRTWSTKVQVNAQYSGSSKGGRQLWSVKAHTNYYSWISRLYAGQDSEGNNIDDMHNSISAKTGIDGQLTFVPRDDHRFTTGAEFNVISIDANIFGKRDGFGGAIFVQDEINTFNPLVATIGLRGDVFHVNASDEYHGETYGNINPKIGAVYHITDDIALRSNFGTGYRMPTMSELFTEIKVAGILDVNPNPNLRAEQAYSAEGGFSWISGSQLFDFAVFSNWYKDMIEPQPDERIGTYVQFKNIQDAHIYGAETSMRWNMGELVEMGGGEGGILHRADFNFSYLFTKAINTTDSEKQGETVYLPYRPEHTLMLITSVNYWKHGSLAIDTRWKSKPLLGLYDNDPTVDQRVIDVTNRFTYDRWTLQLKVSNLLNWNYIEIDRNIAPIRRFSAHFSVNF
ncbi:MAG TPA: TonB-dependent receptor [candidate division Zixibacteria bacterium]|nr:TonB-dependent receptor [candidate division Zixibacteria bacterium]